MSLYRSETKHIRIDYTPLDIACHCRCVTPHSPAAQASNSLNNEYEPDRTVSPTVIASQVNVRDSDGVFESGCINHLLSLDSIKWIVNDKIELTVNGSTDPGSWPSGSYSIIQTSDENRGNLIVKRNIAAGEKCVLKFVAEFVDWRTGVVMHASSDNDIALVTTDKGEDQYGLSVDNASCTYDPVHDELLLWDYLNGKGMPVSGSRESHINGKSYLRTITAVITKGTKNLSAVPGEYTFGIYPIGSSSSENALEPMTRYHPEIVSVSYPNIVIDMRCIDKAEYEVRLVKNSVSEGEEKVKARKTVSFVRIYPRLTICEPARGADVGKNQKMYYNEVLMCADKENIPYPELLYVIQWFTRAKAYNGNTYVWGDEIKRNIGSRLAIEVENIGMKDTEEQSCFEVGIDADETDPLSLASDDEGNVLMDENGNYLLL